MHDHRASSIDLAAQHTMSGRRLTRLEVLNCAKVDSRSCLLVGDMRSGKSGFWHL